MHHIHSNRYKFLFLPIVAVAFYFMVPATVFAQDPIGDTILDESEQRKFDYYYYAALNAKCTTEIR